ncbi:MAG: 2-C-methyl-D-erythritol 2,4-cyclodiphosphate synthase [Candidatus Eisenbacteria bacterium]
MEKAPRIGLGYDAHRFERGRKLVLGGVEIPCEKGLAGHSDADVICHAVADALLGALSMGDIGQLFPDTDPANKDASSLVILERVAGLLKKKRGRVLNVDAMLILETPRVSQHFDAMKKNVAGAIGIDAEQVSVKATKNEGMGFVGRREGAAAIAVAAVLAPARRD